MINDSPNVTTETVDATVGTISVQLTTVADSSPLPVSWQQRQELSATADSDEASGVTSERVASECFAGATHVTLRCQKEAVSSLAARVRGYLEREYDETYSLSEIERAVKRWLQDEIELLVREAPEVLTAPRYRQSAQLYDLLARFAPPISFATHEKEN